ncbi:MAG TPA: hypothetical protein VGO47_10570 [Chlamydiales bacterium]|jgi:hypothetical protein|nr:hypothetical protein [Chlamydiales bacterium]
MMKATLQTPKRQAGQKSLGEPGLSRKYTEEEKGQLLANLDLEGAPNIS